MQLAPEIRLLAKLVLECSSLGPQLKEDQTRLSSLQRQDQENAGLYLQVSRQNQLLQERLRSFERPLLDSEPSPKSMLAELQTLVPLAQSHHQLVDWLDNSGDDSAGGPNLGTPGQTKPSKPKSSPPSASPASAAPSGPALGFN